MDVLRTPHCLALCVQEIVMSEIRFDPELTDEQLEVVNRLTKEQIEKIDSALLNEANENWRKVARLVGFAIYNLKPEINNIPDIYFAQRAYSLVEKGLLVSQGNLGAMGFCEVKLP